MISILQTLFPRWQDNNNDLSLPVYFAITPIGRHIKKKRQSTLILVSKPSLRVPFYNWNQYWINVSNNPIKCSVKMPWHRRSVGVACSGLWAPDQYTYNHIPTYTSTYCKSSVRPPPPPLGRVYSFQTNLLGGALFEKRGLIWFRKDDGISSRYKKLGYNVERLKYKKLEVIQLRIKTHPIHTKFHSRDW